MPDEEAETPPEPVAEERPSPKPAPSRVAPEPNACSRYAAVDEDDDDEPWSR